ncbi:MAG: hypothetical protein OEU92_01625, partial [Alphaproteobacteria bacterium]|nr:hypothetical protein [Alphaproteobacteria bacterium]
KAVSQNQTSKGMIGHAMRSTLSVTGSLTKAMTEATSRLVNKMKRFKLLLGSMKIVMISKK